MTAPFGAVIVGVIGGALAAGISNLDLEDSGKNVSRG